MMMNPQCNFCGSFENLTKCDHCASPVCTRCYLGHKPVCEELTKKRAAGAGQTVRVLNLRTLDLPPLPPEEPAVPAVLNGQWRLVENPEDHTLEPVPVALEGNKPVDPFAEAGVEFAEVDEEREQKAIEQFLGEVDKEPTDASERVTIQPADDSSDGTV